MTPPRTVPVGVLTDDDLALLGSGSVSAAPRDLRSLLVLREAAGASVAVARRLPEGGDHWYAGVVAGVVLLERVGGDRVHHFALAAAADLAPLVVAAVVHPRCTGRAGPATGGAHDWVRADLEVRTDGGQPPVRWSLVSGPCGARLRRAGIGAPEALSGAAVRARLGAVVRRCVGGEVLDG